MTRDQAIALAKAHAQKHAQDHAYLEDSDCADWMPHEWVIDAVLAAAPKPLSDEQILTIWAHTQYIEWEGGAKQFGRSIEQALGITPAEERSLTGCAAGKDGDCTHSQCPQLRDGEPKATGRHCPLDT